MPQFIRLDLQGKGKKSHDHVLYLRDDGTGVTSLDSGHSHTIDLVPQEAEELDQETGQPVVSEALQMSEGADGHIHEPLEAIDPEVTPQKRKEKDIVKEGLNLWIEAESIEHKPMEKAEESERFNRGEQWDRGLKRDLESKDRAALTFNHIERLLDLLHGYQRQNRTDISYVPIEGGDARVADIYNVVTKNIFRQNNFEESESEVFEDQTIAGRGFFHIFPDFEREVEGEIVIEHYPWKDVLMGPHEKKDGSDAEYTIKRKWYSLARVQSIWPEKAKKMQHSFNSSESAIAQMQDRRDDDHYSEVAYSGRGMSIPIVITTAKLVDVQRKEFLVLEIERKDYKRVSVIVNEGEDVILNAEGWKSADLKAVKSIPDFFVVKKEVIRVRKSLIAGGLLLEPETVIDDDKFNLVPAYAKKRGHWWWGKVESAKDPSREHNKRTSQLADIVNKAVAYGWFYDQNTFGGNPVLLQHFKDEVTKPGFLLEVANAKEPPSKEEGIKVPTEVVAMQNVALIQLQQIMNINPALQGQSGREESGIAQIEKKKQALIGNEFLFDNLNHTKRQIGRRMIKLIQQIYTPERIMRILENSAVKQRFTIAGEEYNELQPTPAPEPPQGLQEAFRSNPEDPKAQQGMQQFQQEYNAWAKEEEVKKEKMLAIHRALNEVDINKYDVAVSEMAHTPTMREATFQTLASLAGQGVPVGPDMLFEYMNVPADDKQRLIESWKAQQAAEVAKEDKKFNTELQKTAMANKEEGGVGIG